MVPMVPSPFNGIQMLAELNLTVFSVVELVVFIQYPINILLL